MCCAELVELIEMLFVLWTLGPKESCIKGDPSGEGAVWGDISKSIKIRMGISVVRKYLQLYLLSVVEHVVCNCRTWTVFWSRGTDGVMTTTSHDPFSTMASRLMPS